MKGSGVVAGIVLLSWTTVNDEIPDAGLKSELVNFMLAKRF